MPVLHALSASPTQEPELSGGPPLFLKVGGKAAWAETARRATMIAKSAVLDMMIC